MQTFKLFLEDDTLNDMMLNLFVKKEFGLDNASRDVVVDWINGYKDIDDYPEIWQRLYDHYADIIPYDVAKADANDWEPAEWVKWTLMWYAKQAGVEFMNPPTKRPQQQPQDDY